MGKIIVVWTFLLLALLISSCVPAEKVCSIDKDCMQASCCHASDSVNRDNAPDCSGQLCTMECVPGTVDCGQGEIKCVEGECQAVIN